MSFDDDSDDNALFWMNLLGLGLVALLLGTFAVFYGRDFLAFLIFLLRPDLVLAL